MRMHLIVAGLTMALVNGAAWGQTIRLKSLVTVELHQDVRLGDVATVTAAEGRTAEELANTVIVAGIELDDAQAERFEERLEHGDGGLPLVTILHPWAAGIP